MAIGKSKLRERKIKISEKASKNNTCKKDASKAAKALGIKHVQS